MAKSTPNRPWRGARGGAWWFSARKSFVSGSANGNRTCKVSAVFLQLPPALAGHVPLRNQYNDGLAAPPRLVRCCQAINHGSIEDLRVYSGEPAFDGSPAVAADVKLDVADEARPEVALADFVLSDEVVRLLRRLDQIGDGVIRRIEVRGGIPRRILLATRFSDAIEPIVK